MVKGPGFESDAASAASQQQIEQTREQPLQFQMEQQGFQTQQRQGLAAAKQAEMLNRQMQLQMDPQMRLAAANLITNMIGASKDPMIKARLQAYQGLMLNGQITPEKMMEDLGKMDEYKVLLEQAKAAQAYGAAAVSGENAGLIGTVRNLLPGGSGGTPAAGPAPSAAGGFHIGTATAPDGSRHAVLLDGTNNIVRDLGVAP